MSTKKTVVVLAQLFLVCALGAASLVTAKGTQDASNAPAAGTVKKKKRSVRRRPRPAPAAQDPAANPGDAKATELNNKGEVGGQAADPARGGANRRDPKFIPTPTPVPAAPAKPAQPTEQAGQPAPTPRPRKP